MASLISFRLRNFFNNVYGWLKQGRYQALFLTTLFLLWRFTLLVFFHPRHFFLWPEEELYRGLIALKIANGSTIPILNLLPDNYTGGSLIVGYVAAFFFKIFGPTTFALKLTPLLFSLGAFVTWFVILRRYLNPGVAFYAGLFIIFSPPTFIQLSLTAMGDHYETLFLTALSLLLLFKIVLDRKEGVYPIVLGLLAGFSLWFAYIYGVTLLASLIWWFTVDRSFYRRKKFWIIIPFFVAGFSPWVWINYKNQFSGLVFLEKPLWDHFSWHYLKDAFRFERNFQSFPDLLMNLVMPDWQTNPYASLLRRLYILLLLGPFVLEGIRHRMKPAAVLDGMNPALLWFWIYLVCFAGLLEASDFRADYYCYPALMVVLILAAFYWDRVRWPVALFRKKATKILGAGTLIGITVFANTRYLSLQHAGQVFGVTGYSYYGAGWSSEFSAFSFCRDLRTCCMHFSLLRDAMTSKEKHTLSYAAALRAVQSLDHNGDFKIIPPPRSCPLVIRNYFYYLSGAEALQAAGDVLQALDKVEVLRIQEPSMYHFAVKGLLAEWARQPDNFDLRRKDILERISSEDRPFYWRAAAEKKLEFWVRDYKFSRPPLRKFIEQLFLEAPPEASRVFLLHGLGRAFLRISWAVGRPGYLMKGVEKFPPEIRLPILEGAGSLILSKEMLSFSQVVRASLASRLNPDSMNSVLTGRRDFIKIFQQLPSQGASLS